MHWFELKMIGIAGVVAGMVECMWWNVWRTENDSRWKNKCWYGIDMGMHTGMNEVPAAMQRLVYIVCYDV